MRRRRLPQVEHRLAERRVGRANAREVQDRVGGRLRHSLSGEFLRHAVVPDLAELVDRPQRPRDIGDAHSAVEALDEPPVVHPHARGRQVEALEGPRHHDGDLGLEVRGQRLAGDDVDVGLVELPEAALLRALPSPHLLDLVAPEREREVALTLLDVAREGHGQVEVKAELGRLSPAPREDVDLLGGLRLAAQALERLDRARLDLREAVKLEDLTQAVDDVSLDETLGGGPFGEA